MHIGISLCTHLVNFLYQIFNFLSTACCPTLNINTGIFSSLNGNYTSGTGFINEINYWVSPTGEYALWYIISYSTYFWLLGPIDEVGSITCYMFTMSSMNEKKCPNNEGYIWKWNYWNSTISDWIPADDLSIKCANEDDFCTSANQCGLNQGDCDLDDECQTGFECGSNNCPDSLGFDENEDCCVEASGNSRKVEEVKFSGLSVPINGIDISPPDITHK